MLSFSSRAGHRCGKSDFAAVARAQQAQAVPAIDGTSGIQEIKVIGNWAFMWTRLRVLARDANLLAPVKPPGG